jgi:hypothetical protein
MPINMFFIVKNHWEPYFTDNPRIKTDLGEAGWGCVYSIVLTQDRNKWKALVNAAMKVQVP